MASRAAVAFSSANRVATWGFSGHTEQLYSHHGSRRSALGYWKRHSMMLSLLHRKILPCPFLTDKKLYLETLQREERAAAAAGNLIFRTKEMTSKYYVKTWPWASFHQHHEDQQAALITQLYVTTMQIQALCSLGICGGIIMKVHEMDYRSSLVYIRLVPKPIADYH